jgi:spore germination cell wall hydrolase CwlJ-like protein
MKISTALNATINTAVAIGIIVIGSTRVTHAKAETLVMLGKDTDISITQSLSFNEEKFPEVQCMALNIYYETRSSNLADNYAVADVVLNRVEDTRYPDSICEVVKEGMKHTDGRMKRDKCQFSWYCDGKSDVPRDRESWKRAQSVAWDIVKWDNMRGLTEGSTHYHTTYVNPRWNKSRKHWSITRVGRIGAHIFYRWN